jgi:gluconolactonase
VRSNGTVYFTDPTYGRMPVFGLERRQELPFQGRFRIARDSTLNREADDFSQPNGLCLSPDERILYVNDTTRAHIRAFDVAADGSLSNNRIVAEYIGTGDYNEGVVNGIKCDEHGNVYVTGPGGIWVISGRGKHLGIIRMPEIARNMNWSGRDWSDLYCACSTSIYRVRRRVRGNRVAYMGTP